MEIKFFVRTWAIFFVINILLMIFFYSLFYSLLLRTIVCVFSSYGILFYGFFTGLAIAFMMPGIKIVIQIENKKRFMKKLNFYLNQIGYIPKSISKDYLKYKHKSIFAFPTGYIIIQLENKNAIITGLKYNVKKLENWMINY